MDIDMGGKTRNYEDKKGYYGDGANGYMLD